jgi:hypothetical protein
MVVCNVNLIDSGLYDGCEEWISKSSYVNQLWISV